MDTSFLYQFTQNVIVSNFASTCIGFIYLFEYNTMVREFTFNHTYT